MGRRLHVGLRSAWDPQLLLLDPLPGSERTRCAWWGHWVDCCARGCHACFVSHDPRHALRRGALRKKRQGLLKWRGGAAECPVNDVRDGCALQWRCGHEDDVHRAQPPMMASHSRSFLHPELGRKRDRHRAGRSHQPRIAFWLRAGYLGQDSLVAALDGGNDLHDVCLELPYSMGAFHARVSMGRSGSATASGNLWTSDGAVFDLGAGPATSCLGARGAQLYSCGQLIRRRLRLLPASDDRGSHVHRGCSVFRVARASQRSTARHSDASVGDMATGATHRCGCGNG